MAPSAESLLECRGLVTGFGANQVLHGVDLTVGRGEIVGIFGLNGAGKSVTMKTISGLLPLWEGEVRFDGRDLAGLSPEARVAAGIGNVPQGRQVFPELTVDENLRIGAYTSRRRSRADWQQRLAGVHARFPVLADRRDALAGTLSGGQQASLAVARALVNEPTLLLVDEPSAGLAPKIVEELLEILTGVARSGMTMLVIEQNVRFGLQLVERAAILQAGRVVHSGPTSEIDEQRLAELLGIGRMLRGSTTGALTARPAAPVPTAPNGPRAPRRRRRRPLVAPTLEELRALERQPDRSREN